VRAFTRLPCEEIAGDVFRNDNSNAPGTDFSIPVAGKR